MRNRSEFTLTQNYRLVLAYDSVLEKISTSSGNGDNHSKSYVFCHGKPRNDVFTKVFADYGSTSTSKPVVLEMKPWSEKLDEIKRSCKIAYVETKVMKANGFSLKRQAQSPESEEE